MAAEQMEVPPHVVAPLRAICLALPEAREEEAWVARVERPSAPD